MKNSPTLLFGKYKGQTLSDVPMSYLGWLINDYSGTSISKKDIEAEAISRGCFQRNGVWGYYRDNPWDCGVGFDTQIDCLGNLLTRRINDEGDDYEYEGIPNME